eukprot:NODE_12880_length_1198_cov_3.458450.p1 GENE.NODE_12880_length_1198_cov_3.458450~~NODE_12880_length_1198_cov_3.458450.p1  ORF type:complete len:230 (+),score=54.56 NODE_12880_length_1198_cov_3.458450:309-998(+)
MGGGVPAETLEKVTLISGPPTALIVSAKKKLNTPEEVERFIKDLQRVIEGHLSKEVTPVFKVFDVSQNRVAPQGFHSIFAILRAYAKCVKLKTLRLHGCPSLNDQAIDSVADWLADVTSETVPNQLHLSHGAITTKGFTRFMDAIKGNTAFPPISVHTRKPNPTYLRIEKNYIDEGSMWQNIEEGVMYAVRDNTDTGDAHRDSKLKVWALHGSQLEQRQGNPPTASTLL